MAVYLYSAVMYVFVVQPALYLHVYSWRLFLLQNKLCLGLLNKDPFEHLHFPLIPFCLDNLQQA